MPRATIKLSGINVDLPPWEVPENWTGGENIHFRRGFADRVDGDFPFLTVTPIPEYIVNSFDAVGNWWVSASVEQIEANSGAGWTDITPLTYVDANTANGWTGGVFNGNVILNSVDNANGWYWDKVDTEMQDLPNSPTVKAMRPYRDFLIGMDTSDEIDTSNYQVAEEGIAWSNAAVDIPDTWIPTTSNFAGGRVLGATSGPVLDGIQLRDAFIIGKSDSIHVMNFIGGQQVMAIRQLETSGGILARNCLAEFENVVYMLTNTGDILATDGSNIASIADNMVRDTIFAQLAGGAPRSFVAINKTARELWVCPQLNLVKYPQIIFVFDIDTKQWGLRSVYGTAGDGWPNTGVAHAVSGVNSSTTVDTWDGGGSETWDTLDGKIWNQSAASPNVLRMIFASPEFGPGHLMEADGSVDIRPARAQKDGIRLGDGDEVVTIRRMWLDAETNAAFHVELGARYGDNDPYVYAPAQDYGPDTQYIPVMSKGREFSVRLTSTGGLSWSNQSLGFEFSAAAGRF
ncbi:MAG: hypothetical protein GY758_01010 [Fuerstiella sp.]|nr:hypothetical protein [Fuerstiella sp.]